jgi:O-antigen ligase
MIAVSGAGALAEQAAVVALALLAAFAVLAAGRPELERLRALAMLAALVATPVVLAATIWDSPQVRPLRHHPLVGGGAVVAGLVVVGLLAGLILRRREALALLVMAALPFRVPIAAGGQTSNLLVPLYVVIAAGVVAHVAGELRRRAAADPQEPPAGWLEWALMGLVVLYAAQASYSHDFTSALMLCVFFYLPFSLLYVQLRRVRWSRRLLLACLGVLVALAVAFVAVGLVEYSRRQLLLNPKVISANQVESYFRVNSLFFDPNIYGRFLAIVMLAVAAAMLWSVRRREVAGAAAVLAVLWAGLMTSISQSSIGALLLGLGVLTALRFSVRRTLAVGLVLVVAGTAFVLVDGSAIRVDLSSSKKADQATTGRYELIRGGIDLFAERPLLGFGPGSFALEYRRRQGSSSESAVSASHTIPITIAAEQGVAGLVLYLLVLAAALGRLFTRGVRDSPARMAVAAGFVALVLHTLLYADFLEDPITWTLLGIGTALAAADAGHRRGRPPGPATAATAPAAS